MYLHYAIILIYTILASLISASPYSLRSLINGTNQTSPAAMLQATNQTPIATNRTILAQRGVLFAFGCDADYLWYCRPHFDAYVQNVLGAIACLEQHAPSIPIALAIPDPSFLDKSELSRIPHVYVDPRLMKTAHISKALAAESSPYNYTLVLDADTCVMSSDVIKSFFDPLQFYDFVSVWECCALVESDPDHKGELAFPSIGGGWEPQTGAFSVRASAKELMLLWANEYIKRYSMYYRFSSRDQQALAYIFEINTNFRFFTLPARFNWRKYTSEFSPSYNSTDPAILHDHRLHGRGTRAESRRNHADSLKAVVLCETIKAECAKISQGSMC